MTFLRASVFLGFLAASSQGHGANEAVRVFPSDRVGGIVADQTVTVAGQDFYQQFVAAWRERDSAERYAISIHERPSARWGSQVWIQYAERKVFQAALPAGRVNIRQLGEQAAEITFQKVTDAEVERLLFRDVDLGPDEM